MSRRRSEVFRFSFLQRFQANGAAAKLVAAGDVLFEALLAGTPAEPVPTPPETAVYREVRALALDLRFEEEQLRKIGRDAPLSPADARLAALAGQAAQQVRVAVGALQAALGDPPPRGRRKARVR